MAYSAPIHQTVSRAIATSDFTVAVSPPKGATQCRVVGVSVNVTTTYNAVTTAAYVAVGVPSNLTVAGQYVIPATTAPYTSGMAFVQGSNPLIPTIDLTGIANPSAISVAQPVIEALGPVTITFKANTGGTPAGAGTYDIILAWF